MRLTSAQSRELLRTHGVFVREACDTCAVLIHYANRFTIRGVDGVWCSRECRDGIAAAERHVATRKGGRPRKYRSDRERRVAQRRQNATRQQTYRQSRSVTENPLVSFSFCGRTEAEKQPLAIPPQQERVQG